MLHAILLLKRSLLATTACAIIGICAAQAQTAQPFEGLSAEDLKGGKLSEEEAESFRSMIRAMQENNAQLAQDPKVREQVAEIARRIDDIANPEMQKERDRIMRFLGIDPEKSHSLFIFVSWSMPLNVLRSYAVEALWTGSTLVFRGVPPGRTLPEFMMHDVRQLIWGKTSAPISIDPRLFDLYGVDQVPSIVLTRTRDNPICSGAEVKVKGANRVSSYKRCAEIDDSKYVQVTGAVTVDYALEAFDKAGFPEANVYLAALRRGYQEGQVPGKAQAEFTGEWNDAIGPILEKYGPPRKIETPQATPQSR